MRFWLERRKLAFHSRLFSLLPVLLHILCSVLSVCLSLSETSWLPYKDDQLLDDGKTLGECGFTSQTARPQAPATVGLAFRADDAFEALRIEPFSSPPELPDVMKPQDSGSSANEQAVQ
uniref:Elongin B n=1 Tax=Felis catus TaxID=9685 RepID=A0ABI7WK33_FELCA